MKTSSVKKLKTDPQDLYSLGKYRFDNFCLTLKRLLINKDTHFDYIIAAGDSGLVMCNLAMLVFDELKIDRPKIITVPLFAKSQFKDEIKKQLLTLNSPIQNVLFVDDEISLGLTALEILDLINDCLTELKQPLKFDYYIVAEDQGFTVPSRYGNVHFCPFANQVKELKNLIFCFIPPQFIFPLEKVFGYYENYPFYLRTNILLGLPIKDFNNGKPIFTDKFLIKAEKEIPNYKKIKMEFRKYVKTEISTILKTNNG